MKIIVRPGVILHPVSASIIGEIGDQAGVAECTVTSTDRPPQRQAEAMYKNLKKGISASYAPPGQAVIAVYNKWSHLAQPIVVQMMVEEILRQGPEKVSNHCLPPDAPIWVVDILPMQDLALLRAFVAAAQAHPRIKRVLHPLGGRKAKGYDPVIHLEIWKAA